MRNLYTQYTPPGRVSQYRNTQYSLPFFRSACPPRQLSPPRGTATGPGPPFRIDQASVRQAAPGEFGMRNPEFGIVQFSLFSRKNRSFSVGQDQGLHRCGRQAAAFQPAEFSKEGSPLFPRSKESKILCTAIPAQDPEPTQGARAVSQFLRRGGYQPPVPILSIAIRRALIAAPQQASEAVVPKTRCRVPVTETCSVPPARRFQRSVFPWHTSLHSTHFAPAAPGDSHFTFHSSLFTNQKRPAPIYEAERPFYAIVIP